MEQPPTYPIMSGNIAREQGDTEAITPPANAEVNISTHVDSVIINTKDFNKIIHLSALSNSFPKLQAA